MKRILIFNATLFLGLFLSTTAHAQTVSVARSTFRTLSTTSTSITVNFTLDFSRATEAFRRQDQVVYVLLYDEIGREFYRYVSRFVTKPITEMDPAGRKNYSFSAEYASSEIKDKKLKAYVRVFPVADLLTCERKEY